jgi:hypothetical protein
MSARSRRGAIAAGLLLFACATATLPIRSEHLGYSGCDREQRRAIARAFDRAALLGETAAAATFRIARTFIRPPRARATGPARERHRRAFGGRRGSMA